MTIENDIKQSRSFRNEYHKASVNLIYIGKWIINFHDEIFKYYNLTLPQYNTLRILKGQHPRSATVKLIKERMLDKAADASRIVENLRKKGMLKRDLNAGDRRSVDIIITQKGINVLDKIEMKESKTLDQSLSKLNSKEIKLLNALLDKI
ncbi:MAG TPA: MarR family transcriptional regulator [Bacteroidia bacterium]